jgi:hypothetical protein
VCSFLLRKVLLNRFYSFVQLVLFGGLLPPCFNGSLISRYHLQLL